MKWMRFARDGRVGFGLLEGDEILVHSGDMFASSQPTGERIEASSIEWLTPCQPTKMLALWNNFRAAADKNGWAPPAEPLYFVKTPNSWAAHGAPIPVPAGEIGRVAY